MSIIQHNVDHALNNIEGSVSSLRSDIASFVASAEQLRSDFNRADAAALTQSHRADRAETETERLRGFLRAIADELGGSIITLNIVAKARSMALAALEAES
jgi:hypothetical protein